MGAIKETASIALEDLLDSIEATVYWSDTNNVLLGCNKAQADYFGVGSREEIKGKALSELFSKECARHLAENNNRVMETGESITLRETGVTKDRKRTEYVTRKSPLRDKSGNIVGVCGVFIPT